MNINKTTRAVVTSVPSTYNPGGAPVKLRVYSNRAVHVLGAVPTDTVNQDNGMPIAADCAETVSVWANNVVHFVLADGETDGNIWFTVE